MPANILVKLVKLETDALSIHLKAFDSPDNKLLKHAPTAKDSACMAYIDLGLSLTESIIDNELEGIELV